MVMTDLFIVIQEEFRTIALRLTDANKDIEMKKNFQMQVTDYA